MMGWKFIISFQYLVYFSCFPWSQKTILYHTHIQDPDFICCKSPFLIERFDSSTVSAVWLLVRHPEMPKTILSCIYDQPSSNVILTLNYLDYLLGKLCSKNPHAKIMMMGDYNKMSIKFLCNQYNLKCFIDFLVLCILSSVYGLCCSPHVPLLYILCPPVVTLSQKHSNLGSGMKTTTVLSTWKCDCETRIE